MSDGEGFIPSDQGDPYEAETPGEVPEADQRPTFEVPATGDPALDEMLRALAETSAVPIEDQLPVIEAVHRGLQDRLADVEG